MLTFGQGNSEEFMARCKSKNRHDAILCAAIALFAEKGLGAPTSAISAAAGIAEGTLFIYFKTKDELLNKLFYEIKLAMSEAMMSGFPAGSSVRRQLQHVWDHYVLLGVDNPLVLNVMKQMELAPAISPETRAAAAVPFLEIQRMIERALADEILRDLPFPFLTATLNSLALMTMEFMRQNPEKADFYRQQGFEILWAGVVR